MYKLIQFAKGWGHLKGHDTSMLQIEQQEMGGVLGSFGLKKISSKF